MTSSVRRQLAAVTSLAALTLGLSACTADDPEPTGSATATDSPSPSESPSESEPPTPSETGQPGTAVPVYFITDSPAGPRLVREFHRVDGDPLLEAARLVAGGGQPTDPDYRTLWPEVEISSVTPTDGVLLVEVPGDGFTSRPDGMSKREARLAVQQLVYTLQGVQQERSPVVIHREDGITSTFDLPADQEHQQASALKTLNHVNITSPEEGTTASGDTLTVSGVANSFEANVICEVRRGDEALQTVPITAEGWMEDKLFPFEGEIPLSGIEPGEAQLQCSTDDPSGGAEGPGAYTDTKTITVD
jgi:hypothetical protein